HREGYYNLGSVLRQQAASLRRGRSSVAPIDPSTEARLRDAREMQSRGDGVGARKVLEPLVRDAPSSANFWNLLGFVQGQERDLAAAIASLKRAVDLDPAMPEARYNLGVALWYGGERTAA